MKSEQQFRLIELALAVSVFLFSVLPVFSQSCALCYIQAGSAGAKMIEALRSGILILIVPPTLGSIAMLFIVHRKRNRYRQDDVIESGQEW